MFENMFSIVFGYNSTTVCAKFVYDTQNPTFRILIYIQGGGRICTDTLRTQTIQFITSLLGASLIVSTSRAIRLLCREFLADRTNGRAYATV